MLTLFSDRRVDGGLLHHHALNQRQVLLTVRAAHDLEPPAEAGKRLLQVTLLDLLHTHTRTQDKHMTCTQDKHMTCTPSCHLSGTSRRNYLFKYNIKGAVSHWPWIRRLNNTWLLPSGRCHIFPRHTCINFSM